MLPWLLLSLLASAPSGCAAVDGPMVLVQTAPRVLLLCGQDGREEGRFRVSLGQGGLGKRRQGDGKTPLGRYPLGAPRPSASGFDTFVPVGYPTPAQRAAGYTGSAIGVHGPPDTWPDAVGQAWVASGNWTLGCIAVATTAEIRGIAAWIEARKVTRIQIR